MADWADISLVDSNTHPISMGVLSSHVKEMGAEEMPSLGVVSSKGTTKDLKDSSQLALVLSE